MIRDVVIPILAILCAFAVGMLWSHCHRQSLQPAPCDPAEVERYDAHNLDPLEEPR